MADGHLTYGVSDRGWLGLCRRALRSTHGLGGPCCVANGNECDQGDRSTMFVLRAMRAPLHPTASAQHSRAQQMRQQLRTWQLRDRLLSCEGPYLQEPPSKSALLLRLQKCSSMLSFFGAQSAVRGGRHGTALYVVSMPHLMRQRYAGCSFQLHLVRLPELRAMNRPVYPCASSSCVGGWVVDM